MAAAGYFMLASLPLVNVITPVSRPENLRAMHANLREMNDLDIRWFTVFEPKCAVAADQWTLSLREPSSNPDGSGIPVEVAVAGSNGGWGGSKRTSPWSTVWPDVGVGDWNFIKKFWETDPEQFHFVPEVGAYYNALRD
jgi:hypothetical protein